MKSYFTIIEDIAKGDKNPNNVLIAKTIMEYYLKGSFLNQKKLASICFLSISSITYFCKKIGLDGYRTLIILLKQEAEKNNSKNNNIPVIDGVSYLKQYYMGMEDIFEVNSVFISELIQKINKDRKITLVLSYSLLNSYDFISSLFAEKNIEVNKINFSTSFKSTNDVLNSEKNILFICLGRDNETLSRIYELIQNKESLFIITTETQSIKFPSYKCKMTIPDTSIFFNNWFRYVLIEMLFLNIFHSLE